MVIYPTVVYYRKNRRKIVLNSQKLTVNRETVIKITAVVAIAALMFSLILVFNGMIGYAADDYLYFFKYTGHVVKGTPERLTGIRDIFTGMVTHYKICNGRIPAHFLLQLFTLFDKSVFNVVNSLFFTLLGLLIYFHANYKRPINIPLLVFIYAFEWLGMNKPASAYIWYSAAFNYLWTTVWILTFLMFYRIHDTESEKPKPSKEIILSVLMFVAGVFAGWTNENMGGATMGAVMLFLIYFKIKKMPVRAHHVTGLLGVITGFGILLLAPGNRVRIDNAHRERNIMKHLLWSAEQIYFNIWRAVLLMLVVFVIVLLIVCIKKKKLNWLLPCIYLLTGAAAAGVLIVSPEAPPRSFFGANIMFGCAAFVLAAQLFDGKMDGMKKTAVVLSVLVALGFGVIYVGEYYALKSDSIAYEEAEQAIYEQKAAGIKDVKIPRSRPRKSYWSLNSYMINITNDNANNKWFNDWTAVYYGVDSVTVVKKPKK